MYLRYNGSGTGWTEGPMPVDVWPSCRLCLGLLCGGDLGGHWYSTRLKQVCHSGSTFESSAGTTKQRRGTTNSKIINHHGRWSSAGSGGPALAVAGRIVAIIVSSMHVSRLPRFSGFYVSGQCPQIFKATNRRWQHHHPQAQDSSTATNTANENENQSRRNE
jgi:hypothetical protein